MKTSHSNKPFHRRRGTIYVIVLMMSLIVSSIALATIQMVRLQTRAAISNQDLVEARSYARAAVDIAMLRIRNNPYWRTQFGNGTWVADQAMGNGRYSIVASDPLDNDVTTGDNHPVVLTGIGMKGEARFKVAVRLEVGARKGSCLEVSMLSGTDTSVSGAVLTSNQVVSANNNFSAGGGSTVNADVEASNSVSGSSYAKSRVGGTVVRPLPNAADTLAYYLANGTYIQYTELPTWAQSEMITNPSFETDANSWSVTGGTATLATSSTAALDGTRSLRISGRSASTAVACQDIPIGLIQNGSKYTLSIPVLATAACTARGLLTVSSTGSGTQTYMTSSTNLNVNGSGLFVWTTLGGDITPAWNGTLISVTVSISMSVSNQYYMDRVSLIDASRPSNQYVITRALLSPQSNPFGNRITNPEGIYVINCAGKDVVVNRSRIVGTLVFLNPGGNSAIQDPVVWEPARNNYPSLMSNDTIQIAFDSAVVVNEAALGANFNPPGAPYPYLSGTTNTTKTETYPCRMSGLMYSQKDLKFSAAPDIAGVVIAREKIAVSATSLSLSYINTYLYDPPPGFSQGTADLRVVPGTWIRSVD